MHPAGRRNDAAGEAGFTLIELLVLVAILATLAGIAFETLAQRPARTRSSAVAFAGLVAQARTLASITGDGVFADGSGATIGVVRDGDDYVATLYAYRPIRGALAGPVAAANSPPLRLPTALSLVRGSTQLGPPFALFFSAAGHVSAAAGYRIPGDGPLATEPACPVTSGIIIGFVDGTRGQAHPLSCEMATLDLDTTYSIGPR